MNKKVHKKNKKFLNINELIKKSNLKELITANPLNSAKQSINKFYKDYKKIREKEDLKKQKQIELEKQRLIKEEKKLIQKEKIQEEKNKNVA